RPAAERLRVLGDGADHADRRHRRLRGGRGDADHVGVRRRAPAPRPGRGRDLRRAHRPRAPAHTGGLSLPAPHGPGWPGTKVPAPGSAVSTRIRRPNSFTVTLPRREMAITRPGPTSSQPMTDIPGTGSGKSGS